MIVMPTNVTSPEVKRMAAAYPGRVGNLISPDGWRTPLPLYALDNGRFTAGEDWDADAFLALCDKAHASQMAPRWLLVPDVVGDRVGTLAEWGRWAPQLTRYGWPLAFAVQDGMTWGDVPTDAAVVFVGGSTEFKWRTFAGWCARYPRVHIGRVNNVDRAWRCWKAGAESIDGTGWMRTTRQRNALWRFMGYQAAGENPERASLFEEHLA